MANPADIQAVQAKQLKNGKYQYIALLADGTEEVIKKAGAFKPVVNVYDAEVNLNARGNGVAPYCTYNSKAGVKQLSWCNSAGYDIYQAPIKSIEVELV